MNYWLDLFTGTTWDEFQNAGSRINGFNARMRSSVNRIEKGDILLCYLTGVRGRNFDSRFQLHPSAEYENMDIHVLCNSLCANNSETPTPC